MPFNLFSQQDVPTAPTYRTERYGKYTVHPFTKARIVAAQAVEAELLRYAHAYARRTADDDVRRELACLRENAQIRRGQAAAFRPNDETDLERALSYEQLSVEWAAATAKLETDADVKAALDFMLIEDLDHLYRLAQPLWTQAERLIGRHTEMMPGRPTVAQHRHPSDHIRIPCPKSTDLSTKIHILTAIAIKQATIDFYTDCQGSDRVRALAREIAAIEEGHLSLWESLLPTERDALEGLLLRYYAAAYLYYGWFAAEIEPKIKKHWETCLYASCTDLRRVAALLSRCCGVEAAAVIGDGRFPPPIRLTGNIDYIRGVLVDTVQTTVTDQGYCSVRALPDGNRFYAAQRRWATDPATVPSHAVVVDTVRRYGRDYRWEYAPHPIAQLADPRRDNTEVGRIPFDLLLSRKK